MPKDKDKFRSSKGADGSVSLIRKGSKYDKDAKDSRVMYDKYDTKTKSKKPTRQDFADDGITRDVRVAVRTKRKGEDFDKAYNDVSSLRREMQADIVRQGKNSVGRKDFPFFKHSTKGK